MVPIDWILSGVQVYVTFILYAGALGCVVAIIAGIAEVTRK
jgi:hypothetical protein